MAVHVASSPFTDPVDNSWMNARDLSRFNKAIRRALGAELRKERECRGWTRDIMVARLPSGIVTATLLTYEHGLRELTISRLTELCLALGAPMGDLIDRAFQSAKVALEVTVLRVDLTALISSTNQRVTPLRPWARNRLMSARDGIVELYPAAVTELAAMLGYDQGELATMLADHPPPLPDADHHDDRDDDLEHDVDVDDGFADDLDEESERDALVVDLDMVPLATPSTCAAGNTSHGAPDDGPDHEPDVSPGPGSTGDAEAGVDTAAFAVLTDEEREVMNRVAAGHSSADLAAWLTQQRGSSVARKTVDGIVIRIMRKLKVSNRARAVAVCWEHGWITHVEDLA